MHLAGWNANGDEPDVGSKTAHAWEKSGVHAS